MHSCKLFGTTGLAGGFLYTTKSPICIGLFLYSGLHMQNASPSGLGRLLQHARSYKTHISSSLESSSARPPASFSPAAAATSGANSGAGPLTGSIRQCKRRSASFCCNIFQPPSPASYGCNTPTQYSVLDRTSGSSASSGINSHPCALSRRPIPARELITDIGTESTSPSVTGDSHQNNACAYFHTATAVTAPKIVCHLWICHAIRQLVPSSPRFCAFQLTDLPHKISNTNLL